MVQQPHNESARLARLEALAVLDSDAEPLFDALARAASQIAEAPIALLTLVDARRQWFKAQVGLPDVGETPREFAFCAHTILEEGIFEVSDARADARFADNPLVWGELDVRFYAGAPIILADGLRMGSLCVIDHRPRTLTDRQHELLAGLAKVAAEALELRAVALQREANLQREAGCAREQLDHARQLEQELRKSRSFFNRTASAAGVGGWELDLASDELAWTDETCRIHDLAPGYQPTMAEAVAFYPPEAGRELKTVMDKAMADGSGWDLEVPFVTAAGRRIWVRSVGQVEYSGEGKPQRLVGAFQDTTIRRRVMVELEARESRFRKLFQYSLGLIFTHDYDGTLLSVNPAAAESLGYSVGELLGRPLFDLVAPERHAVIKAYLLRIIQHDIDEGTIELLAKDGRRRIWQYRNILDDEGDDPYVLGHAQDITESHNQARRLRDLSIRDPLTGCFNRRYLGELVQDRPDRRWGCIAVDLDHFKQVNDTFGHQRGDEMLVAVARFLTSHTRPEDAVIRLGGDEFLLLLDQADERVTGEVMERLEADREQAPIGFSLGMSTFSGVQTLDEGLARADHRLYQRRAERRGESAPRHVGGSG